jgi:hypothetical protein
MIICIYYITNINKFVVVVEDKKDKLWKIRPWLTMMRDNCLKIVPEEHCSVDEMMCQYQGRTSPIRQYIKGKPHPWGFKVWCRAGTNGILYDFDVYQGGDGSKSALGQRADVVLKLTSTLLDNANYKIYADNLFTGIPRTSCETERERTTLYWYNTEEPHGRMQYPW